MYQVITLQGGSQHLNLYWAEGYRHQGCLFFKQTYIKNPILVLLFDTMIHLHL